MANVGQRSYQYRIVNKYGDVLDLTHRRYMPDLAVGRRSYSLVPRVEAGGSVLLGDGQIREKKMRLQFDRATADYDEAYELLNTISSFFRMQDRPFYCENLARGMRARVYGDLKPKHAAGNEYLILKDCAIELDVLDPVWESITPLSVGPVLMDDGDVICISTSAAEVPAYCEDIFPIISLTGNATSEKIFSLETGRVNDDDSFTVFRSLLINEATFGNGKLIVLDGTDGAAYIGGNLNKGMMSEGYPLKFDRRNLYLRYNSQTGTGNVTVEVSFRIRSQYG